MTVLPQASSSPQCSLFGPTRFGVSISDIPTTENDNNVAAKTYACDTGVSVRSGSINMTIIIFDKAIGLLELWLQKCKIITSTHKFSIILVFGLLHDRHSDIQPVKKCNANTEWTRKTKFLEVILDCNSLTWHKFPTNFIKPTAA